MLLGFFVLHSSEKRARKIGVERESLHRDAQMFAGCVQCFARCSRQMLRR
jgi:hypothetical protein